MNLAHRWLCRSSRWKSVVETHVMPWVLEGIDLGPDVLEIGPGPGITTDLLRQRAARLTSLEIHRGYADALSQRMAGTNVTVVCGDATRMSFPDATFDATVSLTMLHHVPSVALQNRLLAEVARVLRPGGVFVGTDSLASRGLRLLHVFDTYVPVDPAALPARLERAGFTDIQVDVNPYAFRFRGRTPA